MTLKYEITLKVIGIAQLYDLLKHLQVFHSKIGMFKGNRMNNICVQLLLWHMIQF